MPDFVEPALTTIPSLEAKEFWGKGGGSQILPIAVQIANDLIDFEVHGVYLSWVECELVWTYETGLQLIDRNRRMWCERDLDIADAAWRFERMQRWERTCLAAKQFSEQDLRRKARCQYAVVRLQAVGMATGGGAAGIMVVGRCAGPGGLRPFSEDELYLLETLAKVVTAAVGGAADEPDVPEAVARRLLLRLDNNRLYLNRRLQDLDIEQILREYLFKAADLCHELPSEAFAPAPGAEPIGLQEGIVRVTAKVVNDNRSALRIIECLSTIPEDWTPQNRAHRYPLKDANDAEQSFAARAFTTRRPHVTFAYRGEVPERYRLFGDVECHLSVPILETRCGEVCGVISVETTDRVAGRQAYAPPVRDAMVLLAAHAAVPLRHAIARRDHQQLLKVYAAELEETEVGIPEPVIRARLLRRLRMLGYSATTEPTAGPSDPRDGVYRFRDRHGRPLWVVHAFRDDGASLMAVDHERIRLTGERAIRLWDQSRLVMAESALYHELTRCSFSSLEELLRKTADVVTGYDANVQALGQAAGRARVFAIEPTAERDPDRVRVFQQRPVHQAGIGRSEAFSTTLLDRPEDRIILDSRRPILFVRSEGRTSLVPCDEYGVLTDQPDHHEFRLKSVGRTQWVEIPVWNENRVVAKLVLDHFDPTGNRTRGGDTNDAFTAGEMMFVARLSRLLSAQAIVVDVNKALFHLCAVGVHATLFHHSLKQFAASSPDERLRTFVSESQQYLQAVGQAGDAGIELGDLLGRVTEVCGCFLDVHSIAGVLLTLRVRAGLSHHLKPSGRASLLLILATLIDNACRHVRMRLATEPDARVEVVVWADQDSRGLLVGVDDTGVGITAPATKALVTALLTNPDQALFRGKVHGLALASFLAKWEQWTLELRSDRDPTSVQIVIPNVGG